MSIESIPIPQGMSNLVVDGKVVDGRTVEARRYRGLCGDLASDLGGDPSKSQWLLVCRAAALTVQLEMAEQHILTGTAIDVGQYTQLTGMLVRVLRTLGLERRAKDVTPGATIDAHAAAVREAQ